MEHRIKSELNSGPGAPGRARKIAGRAQSVRTCLHLPLCHVSWGGEPTWGGGCPLSPFNSLLIRSPGPGSPRGPPRMLVNILNGLKISIGAHQSLAAGRPGGGRSEGQERAFLSRWGAGGRSIVTVSRARWEEPPQVLIEMLGREGGFTNWGIQRVPPLILGFTLRCTRRWFMLNIRW